jgi:hypothetical protein
LKTPVGRFGRFGQLDRPALGVGLATLLFIAFSAWWLLYDRSLPGGGDPGTHLNIAWRAAELIKDADIGGLIELGPVGDLYYYPPLVHVIGGIPAALGLPVQDWGTIAINLVFVPMLAFGVYSIGKRTYNQTAGLLAAIFALGTPMVLNLFHVFVLDAPLAAVVAVGVAALLASNRFELRRESVIAGALVGVALLIKTAAPLYFVGPVAVMLIGGGWRRWQNVVLAGVAALVVAGPYYAIHLDEVLSLGQESTIGSEIGATGTTFERDARISFDNLSWYSWVAINEQYFVPLLSLFAIGLVCAVRELRTRKHVPELLAGVLGTYFLVAVVLSVRDARYTLPLVVFVSVLATGWIATTARVLVRRIGLAALGLFVAANVAVSATTALPAIRVLLPNSALELDNDPATFTILDDQGYFVGAPDSNDLWQRLFQAAEREGLETARLRILATGLWSEDPIAFDDVSREYGLREITLLGDSSEQPDLRVSTWFDDSVFVGEQGFDPPCGHIDEGIDYRAEPMLKSVLVERRLDDGSYERWCGF